MSQSNSGLGDVRNLLGFLVAGFAGVLNVLGLKSGEIGVVLRNEPVRVSVIATFLLAGALAAVFSIFVTATGHPVPLIVVLIVVCLLAGAVLADDMAGSLSFPGAFRRALQQHRRYWAAAGLRRFLPGSGSEGKGARTGSAGPCTTGYLTC